MKSTTQTIKELMKTKEFKKWVGVWLVIYLWGALTYLFGCDAGGWASFYHAFKLFAFNVQPALGGKASACGASIYVVAFAAAAYTSWGALSLILKRFVDTKALKTAVSKPYLLVFGLGDKAAAYIESELNHGHDNIVVVESDPQNTYIEKFRAKGVAVKIADAKDEEVLEKLNLSHAEHIVALTGSNEDNIEIALSLKSVLSRISTTHKDLYMRIDDGALSKLYKNGSILDDSSTLIIHMFSMARNSARELFLRCSIDGKSRRYIDSDEPFGIVVAGATNLGLEVIGQICELAHLPNENQVTLYCIDQDADAFRQKVEQRFRQIEQIPHITMVYLSLDAESRAFYEDAVWQQPLTHVVLAHESSPRNIAIATELADSTYLHEIDALSLEPRIHIAIYENRMMAQEIDANQGSLGYCDTFACTEKMATREMIVDEEFVWIGKCIHTGYAEKYLPGTTFGDRGEIERKWLDMDNINNRPSNIAQAYHIPLKLKALGLSYRPSGKNPKNELITYNREVLNTKIGKQLKGLGVDDAAMEKRTKDFKNQKGEVDWEKVAGFDYFPESYETLVEKLIRAEHNRWNAYHYLRGWTHIATETNKPTKEHRCLIPMPDMDKQDRYTVLYDLYSILYIPNLLASVGYELVERDDVK